MGQQCPGPKEQDRGRACGLAAGEEIPARMPAPDHRGLFPPGRSGTDGGPRRTWPGWLRCKWKLPSLELCPAAGLCPHHPQLRVSPGLLKMWASLCQGAPGPTPEGGDGGPRRSGSQEIVPAPVLSHWSPPAPGGCSFSPTQSCRISSGREELSPTVRPRVPLEVVSVLLLSLSALDTTAGWHISWRCACL